MARPARLIWTAPALDDIDEIASWIALENPTAADALVRRLLGTVERLRRYPESGRRVPEVRGERYREVVVPPCRVIYRREGAAVLIVHVLRGEPYALPAAPGRRPTRSSAWKIGRRLTCNDMYSTGMT